MQNRKYTAMNQSLAIVGLLFSGSLYAADHCASMPTDGKVYTIVNQGSGLVLDVARKSQEDGADVVQWSSNKGTNQQWKLTDLGNGSWSIRPVHSNKTLDVYNWSSAEQSPIKQWSNYGNDNQQWKLNATVNGGIKIVSTFSKLPIGFENTNRGSRLLQLSDSSSANQRWYFDPIDGNCESGNADNGTTNDNGNTVAQNQCDIPTSWDTSILTQHVVGYGTAESCTRDALASAVVDGGYITFNCGGNKTIAVNSEISISSTNLTVIDGGGTVTLDGGSTNRILKLDSGKSLSVRNLTLTNGYSVPPAGESPNAYSGGALAAGYLSKLEIINSTFKDSQSGGGGALFIGSAGELTVIGSKFTDNSSWYGGAVLGMLSGITIVNSTFTNNSAPQRPVSNEFGMGGAITTDGAALNSPDGGTISICGTTFKDNYSHNGGGVWLWAYAKDKIFVKDSTFEGNTSKGIGGAGRISIGPTDESHSGGTITKPGAIDVSSSSFLSNTAGGNGGALYMDCYGECNVNNSTFYSNKAGGVGGAIQHVGWGEDVGHQATSVTFNNVTFVDNANANTILFGSKFVLNNTVLVSHSQQGFCSDPATNTGYNVLQYSSLGSTTSCINSGSILTSDPLLSNPADNGGATKTMLPSSTSPLLNAGTHCPDVDQRGNSRDYSLCDIGAVEL